MTATTPVDTETGPHGPAALLARYEEINPVYRLIIRWVFIAALTGVAFWDSLASLAQTSRAGGIGAYVWTVPAAAVLVAIGVARRNRTELPIHDRQTDIIVGTMGLVLALLLQGVLLQRYALFFHLLRLDFVAMWLFIVSCCIVLFGLRPVIRFAWVWFMLLLGFSLPYYLAVILFGGGKFAAGAVTLLIAGLGTGIATGRTRRRGAIGSVAAWVVGFGVLLVVGVFFEDAPIQVYQQVPALTAICVVGTVMYLRSRRGAPKRILERSVEPLAAKQVWSGVPLVIVVALVLSTFHLPAVTTTAPISRSTPGFLEPGQPLAAPTGWSTTAVQTYEQVERLYGDDAVLVRQTMTADVGNIRWDKASRPRTVVVDSIVSERPFSFGVYPGRVLYGLTAARLSTLRPVDLGMGITGQLLSVVDDDLLVTWNSLQFAWGNAEIAQRVTIFAVDNHEPDAPFPVPSGNLFPTLRTLLTLLFRGNAVLDQRTPTFKDGELLTVFGRALVGAQFTATGTQR
ncbi:hypothetical protein AB0K11_04680 [Mycobacterium sp. NPDC050551]|uniref:hypothetical protein n=1 Tax=Mycobacterium sp. NPDC050551 TaxID=3155407 RepID=UPI00341780A0